MVLNSQAGTGILCYMHISLKMVLNKLTTDNCLYIREKQNEKVILIVRVDDLIIAANTEEAVKSVKMMFTETLKMKDLGKLSNFLGIDFKRSSRWSSHNDQERYANKILSRFGMQDWKP